MNLNQLHKKIKVCKLCNLWKSRTYAVPGEGSFRATIMFIGLAPGRLEDLQGKPFVGRAGKLLDELLNSINLKRKNVYITSVLKCHPPKNRLPKTEEIKACNPYLMKQIELIKPKIIVLLGDVALKTMLSRKAGKITEIHGRGVRKNKIIYFPTFHPAAGLRSITKKALLHKDFKKLKIIYTKFSK